MGIYGVLNIAQSALATQQMAMEVASHNIANVSTPGYTRQIPLLESQTDASVEIMKLGLGVKITAVSQSFDAYTTRTLNQNTSILQENEAKTSVLAHLETLFNETQDTGLSPALDEFWNAWQDVADHPSGIPERTALLGKAQILTDRFHSISTDIHTELYNMNTNLGVAITELNQITKEIADLNGKIVSAESVGASANDLRDQRMNLVEKVSALVGNIYVQDERGSLTLLTSDGTPLVDGVDSWEFQQSGNEIYWNQIPTDVSKKLTGGKIGGWLDMRDEVLPESLANLDELAGTLIQEVNSVHLTGYPLVGNPGNYFFEDFQTAPDLPNTGDYQDAAAWIRLSTDVAATPANIAAGGLSGAPGDNEKALALAGIQNDATIQIRKWTYDGRGASKTSSLQTETLDDYYRILAGEVGTLTQEVTTGRDFAQTMRDRVGELRDSVSGVNLDEEMVSLMKIQRAHEAAAKLVTTADELLQSVLDMR